MIGGNDERGFDGNSCVFDADGGGVLFDLTDVVSDGGVLDAEEGVDGELDLVAWLKAVEADILGHDDGNEMPFNDPKCPIPLTYGDVFREAEAQYARWNFDVADTDLLLQHFKDAEAECARILEQPAVDPKVGRRIVMAQPAYDQCIKASHIFNLLDARGVISVTERQAYFGRVRALAKRCADAFVQTPAGGWAA